MFRTITLALDPLARGLRITSRDERVFAYLENAFPRQVRTAGIAGHHDHAVIDTDRQFPTITFNDVPLALPPWDEAVTHQLWYALNQVIWHALAQDDEWVSLYGCALEVNGTAVVIAGESGSGKTSLALALLETGAKLYSDEFTIIHRADRHVSGIPRSLMIREGSLALGSAAVRSWCEQRAATTAAAGERVWHGLDATDLFGAAVYAEPSALRTIVVLDGNDCRLKQWTPAQAALHLFRRTNVPDRSLDEIAKLVELLKDVNVYRLGRGPLAGMCALVRDAVA